MNTFTIDDLVLQAKSSFRIWAVRLAMTSIVASVPVFANPILFFVTEKIVDIFVKFLVDKGELGAFIWNTKHVTSSQAQEYREAVAKILELSKSPATSEEWEIAEREANAKFDALIKFSS